MCLTFYLPLKIWATHQQLQHHLVTLQNGSFPDVLIQMPPFNKTPVALVRVGEGKPQSL